MGDGLQLSKDKRHRSSSSIAGPQIERTRSERKVDVRASIPEVDDQFALAEARCDDLQEKIDLVKSLKRKRKLKKRSMTRVNEPPPAENIPLISVRAQSKKKPPPQGATLRRLAPPANPTRGYLDATTVEQHQMLGHMRGFHQYNKPQMHSHEMKPGDHGLIKKTTRARGARADGDSALGIHKDASLEVACGEDSVTYNYSDDIYDGQRRRRQDLSTLVMKKPPSGHQARQQPAKPTFLSRRRHVPREDPLKNLSAERHEPPPQLSPLPTSQPGPRSNAHNTPPHPNSPTTRARRNLLPYRASELQVGNPKEDRPVVELFNKMRPSHGADSKRFAEKFSVVHEAEGDASDMQIPEDEKIKEHRHPRRVKYRSKRYELPTVASQMKQSGIRCYYSNNGYNNLPFVITKSTAPSHNIGVNLQQVLNGLKIQQPLSGIPLTLAHHMGLGHIPFYETKNVQPMLDNREINAIRLGRQLLRLPSYKYMSYNRLIQMYREGDGIVPRFLRSVSRPHTFYTSMYNLATRGDFDGASKTRGSQEAKQSLAEYATLYRAYEQVERSLKDSDDPELQQRKAQLAKELSLREEQIRRVVQECRVGLDTDPTPLRATASTADDSYRYSSFKLNF